MKIEIGGVGARSLQRPHILPWMLGGRGILQGGTSSGAARNCYAGERKSGGVLPFLAEQVLVSFRINGQPRVDSVPPNTLLVNYLRERCGLTGTHIGCDTSNCGACTVFLDQHAVKSCTVLAVQADGSEIETIESLSGYDESGELQLHPLQRAFAEEHGLQCGFCTPGMIMTSLDIINEGSDLDDETIRRELEGNICRCTGYQGIVSAVKIAARRLREDPTKPRES